MSLASCHGKFASLYFGMLSFTMVWFARSRIYRCAHLHERHYRLFSWPRILLGCFGRKYDLFENCGIIFINVNPLQLHESGHIKEE